MRLVDGERVAVPGQSGHGPRVLRILRVSANSVMVEIVRGHKNTTGTNKFKYKRAMLERIAVPANGAQE